MPRYIDMSHIIVPGKAGRKFETEMVGAEEINPNVVHLPGQWYIMHNIAMVSHIATHIEAPYHILKDKADLAEMPLDQLCGEAVILDLRGLPPESGITVAQMQAAADKAGGIRPGDIALMDLGYAKHYGTEAYGKAPYPTTEAVQWLVEQGIKLVGVDATGVELPGSEEHVNHHAFFEANVPVIENVTGFDQLTQSRVTLYAFPIAVAGLESFPLRVVAVE